MTHQARAKIFRAQLAANERQAFVHAVVGSLVLCAALGTPVVAHPHGRSSPAPEVLQQSHDIAGDELRVSQVCDKTLRQPLITYAHDPAEAIVLHNMTISANGKRLVMRLDMSREAAGNLLRRHLSLP